MARGLDWARRRQIMFASIIMLVVVAFGVVFWYSFFYKAPSCVDKILNQGEQGIDCGGPCNNLCKAPRVDAQWTRAVKVTDGVYHGVALIKNPLADSRGVGVTYQMSLYDAGNILIAAREGTFDIEPGRTRAIFEPNIITGSRVPVRAFMLINDGAWEKTKPVDVPLRIVTQELNSEQLLLTATIENTTATAVGHVVADALLYDADNILVAASETKVAGLEGRARHGISFTWATPFPKPVARADIQLRLEDAPRP